MSETKVERNKRLAREWYEWIGKAAYDKVKEYTSDDFVFYPMNNIKLEGVDEFIKYESSNMDPFPGFKAEMKHLIGDGDWVAVHWIFDGYLPEGVHDWLGIETTKNHLVTDVMCFVKFNEDGKICEKHAKYNMLQSLAQLGVPAADKIVNLMQDHRSK